MMTCLLLADGRKIHTISFKTFYVSDKNLWLSYFLSRLIIRKEKKTKDINKLFHCLFRNKSNFSVITTANNALLTFMLMISNIDLWGIAFRFWQFWNPALRFNNERNGLFYAIKINDALWDDVSGTQPIALSDLGEIWKNISLGAHQ